MPLLPIKIALVQQVNGIETPLSLLNNLKRLHLGSFRVEVAMSAKQVVWILIFCPQLKQAILDMTLNSSDYDYLSEYQEIYGGLSRVEDLAVNVLFTNDDPTSKSRWVKQKERNREWIGGTKGTEAFVRFLLVTNKLKNSEIGQASAGVTESMGRTANFEFLHGLRLSFSSLEKLRLLNFRSSSDQHRSIDLSRFLALKSLSMSGDSLDHISEGNDFALPPSLESLEIPFYTWADEEEWNEMNVTEDRSLESRTLPNLKEVVVPSKPFSGEGKVPESAGVLDLWRKRRQDLENTEKIKNEAVGLRITKRGEFGEFCSRTSARVSRQGKLLLLDSLLLGVVQLELNFPNVL